jgi:hypothetical protein
MSKETNQPSLRETRDGSHHPAAAALGVPDRNRRRGSHRSNWHTSPGR